MALWEGVSVTTAPPRVCGLARVPRPVPRPLPASGVCVLPARPRERGGSGSRCLRSAPPPLRRGKTRSPRGGSAAPRESLRSIETRVASTSCACGRVPDVSLTCRGHASRDVRGERRLGTCTCHARVVLDSRSQAVSQPSGAYGRAKGGAPGKLVEASWPRTQLGLRCCLASSSPGSSGLPLAPRPVAPR